ncbi:FKBP-type peptidyl-prolyl cis-trans isomerase [Geobacter sp. SVR]|uniref:FKBP-type peptidyl-prolyl cis-trans isomerase n=1 Tax=Geobacter sp. SVR TaxID=2495594 RepID=UPI00143EF9A8|nr:FKBP-type peptidyl-prolyl cis-trans isomerase [Geobacter sp. SVR]BCS52347.1 peptidyl-prolyl cis-trans isomerase [Geobacter sp. SVR]GCF84994.1 peptidyl-prolyl cis-trans isomerase [Geobacter sp. SVR]
MHRLIVTLLIALLATPVFAAEEPKTEEQKTLYAIGQLVARSMSVFQLSPNELEYVKQGLTDAVTGKKPVVEASAYTEKVQEMARTRRKAQGEKQAAAGKAYIEQAAKEKDAQKTASGLVYIPQKEGAGAGPTASDTVKVNYRGTLTDGKEFDSSYKRGMPAEFRLDGVIKCWTEGLQKMKPGGKAKLVCPSDLAYGENGAGELILPGATLVFDVELLDVKKAESAVK